MDERPIRSLIVRETLLVLIILSIIVFCLATYQRLEINKAEAESQLQAFQTVLDKHQDNLLLQILLSAEEDLDMYFDGLRIRFPQISVCLNSNPPFANLRSACSEGTAGAKISSFAILNNRNHLIQYEIKPQPVLAEIYGTPVLLLSLILTLIVCAFLFWRLRSILSLPLIKLDEQIRLLAGGARQLDLPDSHKAREWSQISGSLRSLLAHIVKLEEIQHEAARFQLAKQVAHDIRSPLSALRMITKVVSEIPVEKRQVLEAATQRISEIADSLLKSEESSVAVRLDDLIRSVVFEKRASLADNQVSIIIEDSKTLCDKLACVNESQFKRVISNLIDNGVEALGGKGQVSVGLESLESQIRIIITDSGRGIPHNLLPRLGRQKLSFGKPRGNGLGLSHARSYIEACGGSLTFESAEGLGTLVTITLPQAPGPIPAHPNGHRPQPESRQHFN